MSKEKIQLEYTIKSSPSILYNRLGTPGGLSEWFSNDVHIKDGIYTFYWDKSEEQAKLLSRKSPEFVRFQWLNDEGEDYFFEFRIQIDKLTKDVALIVTDFVEEDEKEEAILLWNSQIEELLHILGN